MSVTISVQVDTRAMERSIQSAIDDTAMLRIHDAFARYCNPYVPMDEGVLSQTIQVEPDGVTYIQPYAHYMYVGEVYGPNYPIKEGGDVVGYFTNPYGKKAPIIEGGIIVGWYSPPHKYPMGRDIQYSAEKHPLASKEWDKAMMRDRGQDFCEEVKRILVHRWHELYG